MACINCNEKFQTKDKGFKRYSLSASLYQQDTPVVKALTELCPNISPKKNGFVCQKCYSLLGISVKKSKQLEIAKKHLFDSTRPNSYIDSKRKSVAQPSSPIHKKRKSDSIPHTSFKVKRNSVKYYSMQCIRKSKYLNLLSHLYKENASFQVSLRNFIKKIIRKEMNLLRSDRSAILRRQPCSENIENFKWQDILTEANQKTPLLLNVLRAAITTRQTENTVSIVDDTVGKRVPKLGAIYCAALYSRFPCTYKLVPAITSLVLWKCGASHNAFKYANHLGWSLGVKGAAGTVDRLTKDFDSIVKRWAKNIQVQLKNINTSMPEENAADDGQMNQCVDKSLSQESTSHDQSQQSAIVQLKNTNTSMSMENAADYGQVNQCVDKSLSQESTSHDQSQQSAIVQLKNMNTSMPEDNAADDDQVNQCFDKSLSQESASHDQSQQSTIVSPSFACKGYRINWDNTQIETTARYQGSQRTNKIYMWANCYAAENMVSFNHLAHKKDTNLARNIAVERYLPSQSDYDSLKELYIVLVERIIVANFSHFQQFYSDCATPHVPHQYSDEAAKKTAIVNLGVIDANPSSTAGAISIIEHLQDYVPVLKEEPFPLVCHVDGGAFERMVDASRARLNAETSWGRLTGLVPSAQEFHKRGILMQKRPHVKTEKMAEFMRSFGHSDGHSETQQSRPLLRCPREGCDKVLTSMPGLRYHLQTHLNTARIFTCDRCRKTFKSSNGLKYHQMKTRCEHVGDKAIIPSASREVIDSRPYNTCFDTAASMESRVPQLSGHCHTDDCQTQRISEPPHAFVKHRDMRVGARPFFRSMSLDSCPDTVKEEHQRNSAIMQTEPSGGGGQCDWLTELAIIATSLERPLIEKSSTDKIHTSQQSYGCSSSDIHSRLHSYARPPLSRSPSPIPSPSYPTSSSANCEDNDFRVSSSSPCPTSPRYDEDSGIWSHSWPTAVWQCFIRGTRIRFTSTENNDWQLAEDLGKKESLSAKASLKQSDDSYAPNGLLLLHIEECRGQGSSHESQEGFIRLRFASDQDSDSELIAECALDHPFFVKDKGWSSFHPSLTVEHYGIPCSELEVHDLCLPQGHPDATFDVDVFESFKSYDFTPMDSSAVFTLSSMAQQRRDQELSPRKSPPASPSKRRNSKGDSGRAKRPMNAFMLFAKKFRMEYTQLYPGKDNRAISVLLGDKWKKMRTEERKIYSQEAKLLAEQQKRVNPDCWKRKRSLSGSF